jgi:hypothetical protein
MKPRPDRVRLVITVVLMLLVVALLILATWQRGLIP